MEIQQTYRMLKYQEALYKKELDIKKKELQEISMEKQNITIKKIHGELYYYAQFLTEYFLYLLSFPE